MPRPLLRLSLLLLIVYPARAADPAGIVVKATGDWKKQGVPVKGGDYLLSEDVIKEDVISATGGDASELRFLRYDNGTIQKTVCPANAAPCTFRFAAVDSTGSNPKNGIFDRMRAYITGGDQLPVVYAQARGFTIPDDQMLEEALVLSPVGGVADLRPILKKEVGEGQSLLVQNPQGDSLMTLKPQEIAHVRLPGDGYGVYVIRAMGEGDGVIASSLLLSVPAKSLANAKQSVVEASQLLASWDKETPLSRDVRLTLLLNVLLRVSRQ